MGGVNDAAIALRSDNKTNGAPVLLPSWDMNNIFFIIKIIKIFAFVISSSQIANLSV